MSLSVPFFFFLMAVAADFFFFFFKHFNKFALKQHFHAHMVADIRTQKPSILPSCKNTFESKDCGFCHLPISHYIS